MGYGSAMDHFVDDVSELSTRPKATSDATELGLGLAHEPAEPTDADLERTFSLQPWMEAFPRLEKLTIRGHLFPAELHHPNVRVLTLVGGVALTPLRFPRLTRLTLEVTGDAHGVAQDTAAFRWLAESDRFEELEYLDLRGLDVEPHTKKRETLMSILAGSTTLERLRHLGWSEMEDTPVGPLKKQKAAFAHLETFVVSGNRSAYAKPPIKGSNVTFEAEIPHSVPLEDVPAKVAALPQPSALTPKLDDQELASLMNELLAIDQRFPTATLSKLVGAFAKARQWRRVDEMLDFAKKKAPNRRAFMDVREAVQTHVAKALQKKADPEGQALHDRLEEANRL